MLQELQLKERRERRAAQHVADDGPPEDGNSANLVVNIFQGHQRKNKGARSLRALRASRTLQSTAPQPATPRRAREAALRVTCGAALLRRLRAGWVPPYHKDSRFYQLSNLSSSKGSAQTAGSNPVLADLNMQLAAVSGQPPSR